MGSEAGALSGESHVDLVAGFPVALLQPTEKGRLVCTLQSDPPYSCS